MDDNSVLTEALFWAQVLTDAQRTVICPPEWESRCKGYVDARRLGGLIKVIASPWIPGDRIVVMDEHVIEASWRQALQRTPLVPYPGLPSYWDNSWLRWPTRLYRRVEEADHSIDQWKDDGGA
jgi:hypothetical protein